MMDVLKQGGTLLSEMDWLKMDENTGESWVAQCLRVAGETLDVFLTVEGEVVYSRKSCTS